MVRNARAMRMERYIVFQSGNEARLRTLVERINALHLFVQLRTCSGHLVSIMVKATDFTPEQIEKTLEYIK